MTEDEAKMKQCCGPCDCGIYNEKPYPARWCTASACMAWRWDPEFRQEGFSPPRRVTSTVNGYCGLAGVPER